MTFRYLRLCCFTAEESVDVGGSVENLALAELDAQKCFVDIFIRQESLREDLIHLLVTCFGIELEAAGKMVPEGRLNDSGQRRSLDFYYDKASRDLVAEKESFMLERFGYSFPEVLGR